MGNWITLLGFDGRALVLLLVLLCVAVPWFVLSLRRERDRLDDDLDNMLPERAAQKWAAQGYGAARSEVSAAEVVALADAQEAEQLAAFRARSGGVDPLVEVRGLSLVPVDRTAEDAAIDPELLLLEAEVVELLRTTHTVDPPLYVWDRIEAAINRPSPGSVEEAWALVLAAVVDGRTDFGGGQ